MLQALTQQNARLLAHLSTYDQQRQALANQVNLLRERYALKTSENSGLMMEVASLRKALKDNGVSVEENLATVNGSMPSSGAMPTLPMRPGGQDQHTMQQQLSAALTMPGSSLISSAFASMLPNAGQLSTLGNGQSSGMSSAAAAAAAAMAATSTLPQIAVQPAQQVRLR